MPTGRTLAQIIAAIPLPPAVGEAVEVEAVADRRHSAASEIAPVPRAAPAAEAGEIARAALAAGQAAAEGGAVAGAASAAVVAGGDTGDMDWISCRCTAENSAVNHEIQRLEDGNVAHQGHDFAVLRGLCTPRPGDFLRLVQQSGEARRYGSRAEDIRVGRGCRQRVGGSGESGWSRRIGRYLRSGIAGHYLLRRYCAGQDVVRTFRISLWNDESLAQTDRWKPSALPRSRQ